MMEKLHRFKEYRRLAGPFDTAGCDATALLKSWQSRIYCDGVYEDFALLLTDEMQDF